MDDSKPDEARHEAAPPSDVPLIRVRNLKKYYPVRGGLLRRAHSFVKAVDGVSFSIEEGETLGLVGESGCGKSTVGLTMLRLLRLTDGEVMLDGRNTLEASGKELKALRRDMQIILQDPNASLDPRMPVGKAIEEGLIIHGISDKQERRHLVNEMLHKVGLREQHRTRYPHEFSGGQRQRIGIARALALRPRFVVCDEPVSALDVSIQAQILNLLKDLQEEFQLTYLFIAHNMSVVEHISDRVAVMYLGQVVELAARVELFRNPQHPYTQALMSAIPLPNPRIKRKRMILKGDVPSSVNPPQGCRFHTRCPYVFERCRVEEPVLSQVAPGHKAACWLLE